MTTPLDLVADNRKWVRLHENNAHQAEAARRITALLAEVERLRSERDQAREECGHEKHMRKFVSDERDDFIAAKMRAEADRDRLAAALDRVRELMGRMHEFAHTTGPCGHGCSGCVTARWEHDLYAAIGGTDS